MDLPKSLNKKKIQKTFYIYLKTGLFKMLLYSRKIVLYVYLEKTLRSHKA